MQTIASRRSVLCVNAHDFFCLTQARCFIHFSFNIYYSNSYFLKYRFCVSLQAKFAFKFAFDSSNLNDFVILAIYDVFFVNHFLLQDLYFDCSLWLSSSAIHNSRVFLQIRCPSSWSVFQCRSFFLKIKSTWPSKDLSTTHEKRRSRDRVSNPLTFFLLKRKILLSSVTLKLKSRINCRFQKHSLLIIRL